MIIVQIIGGLGNQLFQYAFGRHLAILNNTDLKLDINAFNVYKLHNYGLNHFNIKENIATVKEIKQLKTNRLCRKIGWTKSSHVIEGAGGAFQGHVLSLRGNYYFEGYWGTEKYFKAITPIIKNDLALKMELTAESRNIANQIVSSNSISIHVRRGDYVSNPENLKIYNILSPDYYKKVVEFMAKRVSNPHFFVFSDDTTWVKENIKLDFPVSYVNHNKADKNYEDLHLMSLCKHNIIANSSFSWWGAWLNDHSDKIVVAPQKVFVTQKLTAKDSMPDGWIKM